MTKRGLLLWAMTVVLLATAVPTWARPNPTPVPPNVGPKAGQVSALLPVAKITRGTGKNTVITEAKKGDELVWNDLIKTEKGGRARITLADQSILSLGSQAELRIVKHDARAQQTSLQMAYGRVRAQVANITRDGGSFELRTPTAVAGVIGTDFGVDSDATGGDTFVCLAGAVQVSNADKNVAGSVQCTAGQTTTVMPGKPPSPPKPASLQQLQQLIQDTEPAIIASISPAAALPGTNFDSTIAGTKMGKVNSVSVAGGSGVNATIKSATDTGVTIHVVVEASASAGPRTITLTKESGASSATVFTVLGTPVGDPKKAYLDTLEQMRQTGISGLTGFLQGAQQAADQVAQQITQANQNLPKPLDLSPFANSLNQQYSVISGDLKGADTTISKAAQDAANTFAQLYDPAYQALLQRDPTGTPDTTFRTALTNAFQQANAILQAAITNSQTNLNGSIQSYGNTLNTIQQTWSQNINQAFIDQQAGPLPKVNALERIVEQGATASFDAGSSSGSNASISVNSIKWTLCSQSYQPTGFGQVLDQNTAACTSVSGFQSSTSDFNVNTCALQPGYYYARLAVTDSNNKTSQMDVRVTVLQPNYGSPSTALRGLADSYSSLQLSQFLRWFDSTNFNGYTVLSENIRKTLQTLNSMNINLRVSQENISCDGTGPGTATVRADWQQNYSFTSDPKTVLQQAEQLSVRMQRTPGVGWLITDFQGDNGTVQGVPPVVSNTDVATPDITITQVTVGQLGNSARNGVRRGGTVTVPTTIAPGPNTINAVVTNVGKADLVNPLNVQFVLQDSNGNPIGTTVSAPIPIPLAAGNSTVVTADVNVPNTTSVSLVVTANPTNQAPETNYGNNTTSFTVAVVQQSDLAIGVFPPGTLPLAFQMGQTFAFNVPVSNSGLASPAGWDLVVTYGGQQVFSTTATPALGGTNPSSTTIPVSFTVPNLGKAPIDLKGTQAPALVVTINGNRAVSEINFNNDSASNNIEVADFVVTMNATPQNAIVGRSFTFTNVPTVSPSPYPLPVTFTYNGLPQGLVGNATTISGTPTANGTFNNIEAVGTANNVQRDATNRAQINVGNEITVTPVAAPAFTSGGAAQTLSLNVAGGVYPVTIGLTLPTGFTTTSGTVVGNVATQVIAAPGPVTYNLTASSTAAIGSFNFNVVATDPGIPANGVPAGNVPVQVPYTVNGLPDLQFGTVVVPAAFQMGSPTTFAFPVTNVGTAPAPAGYQISIDFNGTPLSATGPALAVGQTANAQVSFNVPQFQAAPATVVGPLTMTLNPNQAAFQEISTANNTFTGSITAVDFVLNPTTTGLMQGVVGRPFNFLATSVVPGIYPIPLSITYGNVTSGLAASTTPNPNGYTGERLVGTPTIPTNVVAVGISGTAAGVTHVGSATFNLVVTNEIFVTESLPVSLFTGGASQNLVLNVTGGVYPVTVALTLPTGITTTSGTVVGNVASITLPAPGPATFALTAGGTASVGANNFSVTATDGGFAATATPAGSQVFSFPYTVSGLPNLVVTNLTLGAMQEGASYTAQVLVANQGNAAATAGWDVQVNLGGALVGTATGPAIPAGQTVTVPVSITVPVLFLPPVDSPNVPVQIQVNTNQAITESSAADNVFNSARRVVDFTVTSAVTPIQLVAGRSFNVPNAVVIAPVTYPLGMLIGYSPGLPTGVIAGGATGPTNNIQNINLSGTPSSAGTTSVTPTGTADGVIHTPVASPISFNILSEINFNQPTVPVLTAGGPAQNMTVNISGGVYPLNVCFTLPTGITTTSGTVVGNQACQTLAAPGPITFALSADFTAATGTNLTNALVATDAGIPATNTPAGNVAFGATYSVNSNANYVVIGATFQGHTAPFINANALQVGETTALLVTVQNQGNGSPTGTITATADCGNSTACPPPLATASGAAPPAGQSVTITIPLNNNTLPIANYTGIAAISTNIAGAVVGPQFTLPFDVVDFTFNANPITPSQNILIGGSGDVSLSLAVQVPLGGTPFGIPIVPTTTSTLSFTPPTQTSAGANIPFTVNVAAGQAPTASAQTPDMITFTATNHGVAKTAQVPVNYFNAFMTSTSLFVNDVGNPLTVPVATGAQAPTTFPTVALKMNGNYIGGTAPISVQQPGCGTFSAVPFPTSVQPTDTLDLPIFASVGNTCPAGTQVILKAQIPNTQPVANVPVYTLFVVAKGLPQLQVISATPNGRDFSVNPWLAGEPVDFTITVKNSGSSTSNGNEKITMFLNGAEVGSTTLTGSINPGGQGTVTLHAVGSDVTESAPNQTTFGSLRTTITQDTQGDLATGLQDLFQTVNIANWGIQVNGAGVDDNTTVLLNVLGPTSGTANISVKNPANFNPNLTLNLVTGSYNSSVFAAPGYSPNFLNSAGSSDVSVSFSGTPQNGYFFIQVIAQMKDGGIVTAQRQATIHIRIVNDSTSPGGFQLASDRSNICPSSGCSLAPATPVQINGPLPEAVTLTGSLSFCSGGGCPSTGSADLSFTDTFMTVTTPPTGSIQFVSPGNTLPIRVKAADNPDGSINTGSASVNVSATNIRTASARTPTPDPVGNNQYVMSFNVGDIGVTSSACFGVAPGSPTPVSLPISYTVINGFNSPSIAWEWEDSNHIPVGASPLSFNVASGTSTFGGNGYTPLPTFTLTNTSSTGVDGLQTYYLALTVSNGLATATKYFPFDVDLSQAQTFCPITAGARGGIGGQLIRGSWGKASLAAPKIASVKSTPKAAGKLPDLRISATDVSYTPSIPKAGDTVAVRFRISNVGDADATGVPVALQVNGVTVVSDTFDVAAGHTTLAGLQWSNAQPTSSAVTAAASTATILRISRANRFAPETDSTPTAGARVNVGSSMQVALVIDPQKTITQKSTLAKSAPLAHFTLRSGSPQADFLSAFADNRVVLQLSEGGCAGLKFAMGAGSCAGRGDLTITVEDLAKGTYKIEATNGIADLGINNTQFSNANFGSQVLGQSGHTYAIQLSGGRVGLLTMQAVRNPDQLSEAAKRIFRQAAQNLVKKLASGSDAPVTGDTAGRPKDSAVYFDILYQGQ